MATKGLYFDGTQQQYASFDGTGKGLPDGGANRTLEFWMRAPAWTGASENHQSIIELGDQSSNGSAFGVFLSVQQGVAYLNFSWNNTTQQSPAPIQVGALPDNQWHFVAFTYTGTSGMLGVYLDGKNQGSFPIVTAGGGQGLNTVVGMCYIGGLPSKWYFTGSVSGIRIWNVVRTETDIQGDMTNPCTTTTPITNLVASIPLDEGQGTTFKVQDASGNTITSGTINNNAAWNQPLTPNPDPISGGIWFVIQNKADLATDLGNPARRRALTMDQNNRAVMDFIPLQGNYDRFLWRYVSNTDPTTSKTTYQLVNKLNKKTLSTAQTPGVNWTLRQAGKANWGTNAYFLEDGSTSPKHIAYDSTAGITVPSVTNNDPKEVWLLQPMEVVLGYYIPAPASSENVCPFTKKLESEFGVTFYGTITTSDWAILNTHLVIRNEINAIQASYSPSTAFNGWKVLVISGYDNDPDSVARYPMVKDGFDVDWVRKFWGGIGYDVDLTRMRAVRIVFLTEWMICHKGVPYRQPFDLAYREFDQTVHEFGHAIDYTLPEVQPENQPDAQEWGPNAVEWFPCQVQFWFHSDNTVREPQLTIQTMRSSKKLTPNAPQYLGTIFNTSNDWLPPRWLRDVPRVVGIPAEYSQNLTPGCSPSSIIAGSVSDGNLWFTECAVDKIGRITRAGTITEYSQGLTSGSWPSRITRGPDGNLWFTEYTGNRIGRITLAGNITEYSNGLTPSCGPSRITRGPDGNLWFTECLSHKIGCLDPKTGNITEYSNGLTSGCGPSGITLGPDNNLWFTEYTGHKIGRITPAGTITEYSQGLTPNCGPSDITLGPDGNLWFTERDSHKIGRITPADTTSPAGALIPAGTITEYSQGLTSGCGPSGITLGPDGNLWFAEYTGHKIGRITPAGTITEYSNGLTSGCGTYGITLGPDGNLWFTERDSHKIGRITPADTTSPAGALIPAGTITEYSQGLTSGCGPSDIIARPVSDGNLWFTEYLSHKIGCLDPKTGNITEYSQGLTSGCGPSDITVGPDGNLWFTERDGNRIGRITLTGNITEYSQDLTSGCGPSDITVGPDGNLWFAEYTGHKIGRITPADTTSPAGALIPAGTITEYSQGLTPNCGPSGITVGPDNNLWFTERDGNRIGCITPAGTITEYSQGLTPQCGPRGITAGPDGNLWFTEYTGHKIGRITPAGTITEYSNGLTPGCGPYGINLASDGNLWFTERDSHKIGRITPADTTSPAGALIPAGTITEYSQGLTSGCGPSDITAGLDGNLWLTESAGHRIGRIFY